MASAQPAWGIDLGRAALKAIKLRPGVDGKVEVVAHDYIEHAKILTQPDADRAELIAAALETFLSRNDISKDNVVVSVPGQQTLARFSKLPPVAPKRIPDIVRYEADQQIPFDMDEVIWDYQTFQEEDLPDIEVGIFAMKRELVREHLLHFEQNGIAPIAVQSGPLAAYNAAHFDGLLGKETTILLDIGAESTDLIIATPTRLWTRTIAIGGNNFTEALVKSFKLSFSKAESLKRTAASSKYARQIFQAMRPIFADIVQEMQRSIGFYSSTHRDAQFERVIGVGNAFLLPGLQKYLQQNLGMPVELPKTLRNATVSGSQAESVKANLLSSWIAYGLALQGVVPTTVTTTLLPVEIAKQAAWSKKRPAFAAAAAGLILTGGIIWFRHTADMRALAAASEGAEGIRVQSVEEAARILDTGPPANLAPRAQAAMVLAAGNELKKAVDQLRGQGETERTQALALVQAQRNKVLVPHMFQAIHEAVPLLPEEIMAAGTAEQMRAAIVKTPRGERRLVTISMLQMDYVPDVDNPRWFDSLVESPPPLHDFASGEAFAGFLIKIICRTPNQGGVRFINEAFIKPLREKGRRPELGFHFDRVSLIRGEKVVLGGGSSGSPLFGSRGTGAPGVPSSGTLDPLTDEPMNNDWEFEVWVDAFPQDYAEVAPEETEEGT